MPDDRVIFKPDTEEDLTENIHGRQIPYEGGVSYLDDISYHRMADFLGISPNDRRDSYLAERISLLTDWAKIESKSKDILDQKIVIKGLIRNLGYQYQGRQLILNLYKWIRLDIDKKRIEKEMSILEPESVRKEVTKGVNKSLGEIMRPAVNTI